MKIKWLSTTLALLGLTALFTPSCSDDPCIAGMQVTCPCPGGVDGVQVCRFDGNGFDACDCPDTNGASSSSGQGGTGGVSSGNGGDGGTPTGSGGGSPVGDGDGPGMDQDLDGWAAEWGDCDDNNPEINPSAPEIPDDGIDQNCNGIIDEPDGNGGGDSPTVSTTKVAGTDYCYATAFSLPIGAGGPYNHCKDGDGWYVATEFRQASPCGGWSGTTHLGEDWNKETGGNSDLGAPVNATADGVVVYVKTTTGDGWGQVVIVRHDAAPGAAFALPGGGTIDHIYSQYAHLQNIAVSKGIAITKGQKLAEIGPHPGGAHLHFEISRPDAPTFPGPGYSSAAQGRVDP
ncbi:MAG TPA: peptidoglycan DD-metalloendopeptidase family protein, partial [Polyangium sp.]|nr:peptidoglycan DD-metalloendopeptidase family protein [Polyangium sp.]